jgi:peroxiredoxin
MENDFDELVGKAPLVIYFYPKDNTPCTPHKRAVFGSI